MTARSQRAAARSTSTTKARTHPVHHADRERRAQGVSAGQASSAPLMGVAATGNGRRESFAHLTLPAHDQTTYMPAGAARTRGDHRVRREGPLLQELRRRPGRHHLRQVRVSASEAYLIENGGSARRSRRDADRQRSGGHDPGLDGGSRPQARRWRRQPAARRAATCRRPSASLRLRVDGLTVGGNRPERGPAAGGPDHHVDSPPAVRADSLRIHASQARRWSPPRTSSSAGPPRTARLLFGAGRASRRDSCCGCGGASYRHSQAEIRHPFDRTN